MEIADSVDEFKPLRSMQGFSRFPNIEMLDARIASALNKITQNFYIEKKVSLEEQKAQKREQFSSWKTDRLHDLRLLSCHWLLMIQFLTVPNHSLSLFATT